MTTQPTMKTSSGRFFEDFRVGEEIVHATPRTVTAGDIALYLGLYGSRFAVTSAETFAARVGFERWPIDPLLAFHLVFGSSVPDISLNAVANLGYAGGRFGVPVHVGDTLSTRSRIVGLRPNANGKTGIVYVEHTGLNQRGEVVLELARWVMVRRRDVGGPVPETVVPDLPEAVAPADLVVPFGPIEAYGDDLRAQAGSPSVWDDYAVGERIDHVDAMTVEEAEHMLATRLYQNTARVHFDQFSAESGRLGRRLVYGGHVMSMARALSFNGLQNAWWVGAINAGTHANPTLAGDTIFAWSEVLAKDEIPGRTDVGALRTRLVATKDHPCADHPLRDAQGSYQPYVVLDLDLTLIVPRG